MLLSLTQTAQLLGKTRRQVEYLIKQGRLKARKDGGRWQVDEADLPLSQEQRRARRRRADALRDAATEALERTAPRPRWSMSDLNAFRDTRALWLEDMAALPTAHPARDHLHAALEHLAVGCHRFEPQDKAGAYRAARDRLALAACELFLDPDAARHPLAERIENEAIPSVAGLLRRGRRKR